MNIVDKYRFGKIVINGESYSSDLIIFKDFIKTKWWRKEGHNLHLEDLEILWERKPDILVVGTGSIEKMKVPEELIKNLNEKGISVVIEKTPEAVEEYNNLIKKGENVVAALHLTC